MLSSQAIQEPAYERRIQDWISEQYDFVAEVEFSDEDDEDYSPFIKPSPRRAFVESRKFETSRTRPSLDELLAPASLTPNHPENVETERMLDFLLKEMARNPVSSTFVQGGQCETEGANSRSYTPTPSIRAPTPTPVNRYPSEPRHSPTNSTDTMTTSTPSTPTLSHGSSSFSTIPDGWESDRQDAIRISPSKKRIASKRSMPLLMTNFSFKGRDKMPTPEPISPKSLMSPREPTTSSLWSPLSFNNDDEQSIKSGMTLRDVLDAGPMEEIKPKPTSKRQKLKSYFSSLSFSSSSSSLTSPTSPGSKPKAKSLKSPRRSKTPRASILNSDSKEGSFWSHSNSTQEHFRSSSHSSTPSLLSYHKPTQFHLPSSPTSSTSSHVSTLQLKSRPNVQDSSEPALPLEDEIHRPVYISPRPSLTSPSSDSIATALFDDSRHDSILSFANLLRSQYRHVLVVESGDSVNLAQLIPELTKWCESFDQVRKLKYQRDGSVHVSFNKNDIVHTICQTHRQATIDGVGNVYISHLDFQ